MDAQVLIPLGFFGAVAAVILVPIYLKNRLYQKQLEVIALALEKGIEPERIQLRLPHQENSKDDLNDNWKAGLLLIAIGVVYSLFVAVPAIWFELGQGGIDKDSVTAILPGAILITVGAVLLHIHRTVVGEVLRRKAPADSDELRLGGL